jgi:hypothetical protein
MIVFSVLTAGLLYVRYEEREESRLTFVTALLRAEPNYEWQRSRLGIRLGYRLSSELWDTAQRVLECCGLAKPDDWNRFRPVDVPDDVLPRSCCPPQLLLDSESRCHAKDAFKVGCLHQHDKFKRLNLVAIALDTASFLILAILALFVVKRVRPAAAAGLLLAPSAQPSQRARFDDSVQLRPVYPAAHDKAEHQKPPAYGVAASAPPPPPGYMLA